MDIKIFPSNLNGLVKVPSSKSITHRYLICAALSKGKSVIENPLLSDDTLTTIDVLKQLGAKFKIYNDKIVVIGCSKPKFKERTFTILESATTLRLLLPVLMIFSKKITINSTKRLLDRIYTNDLFALEGLDFQRKPHSISISGGFLSKKLILSGKITTQLISGILIALPYLGSDFELKIEDITFDNPYISLTLDAMKRFGVNYEINGNLVSVKEKTKYQANNYTVEGDFSNGAVWLAASYLHKNVQVGNLNISSIQGDRKIIEYFHQMGVDFEIKDNNLIYKSGILTGNTFDIVETPDLAPILVSIASLASGSVIIKGTEKLSYKESDRKLAIMEVINQLGGNVKLNEDEIIIQGVEELKGDVTVSSYNDHRIVMAAAIMGSVCKKPIVIKNAEAVNKSYPNFFSDLAKLDCKFEVV